MDDYLDPIDDVFVTLVEYESSEDSSESYENPESPSYCYDLLSEDSEESEEELQDLGEIENLEHPLDHVIENGENHKNVEILTSPVIEDIKEKCLKAEPCPENVLIGDYVLKKVAVGTFFRAETCGEPLCCFCQKQERDIVQFVTTQCKHKIHYSCAAKFWSWCVHCPSCGINLLTDSKEKDKNDIES